MDKRRKFLDPRTLARIKGLRLRAQHIVEGYVSGLHRSPFHGFSIEFAEHREYAPGDDLRYLDWKVFGRSDKFYLKQFEDETNLICYLVVDVSESMRYRGPNAPWSKLEYAQCMAAAFAWLVLQQQDSVGLATFDDRIRSFLRPSAHASHLEQILEILESSQPREKTSAGPIFHDLAQRLQKRGVVVILSDLFDETPSLIAGLRHFRHRRHDVVILQVLDPAELDFPFTSPTLFRGLEQLPDVEADPRSLRKAYLREFNGYLKEIRTGCRDCGIDHRVVRTDEPLDDVLSNFLAARAARVK